MQVIYGLHPVLEYLRSGGENMEGIILSPDKKGVAVEEILDLARSKGIPVRRERTEAMDRMAQGKRHQGVLSLCGNFAYTPLDDIISEDTSAEENRPLLILDSVTDPRNLGSLVRSAHCFGARCVVIPKDRAAPVTPSVIKASAGSAHHIAICQAANIARTMDLLKEAGYWIYGADASEGVDCRELDYLGRIALVMGSESSGLRPLVRQKCDFLIKVPMEGVIDSLNVSVAGGIILYEAMQCRLRTAASSAQDGEK
ncbi:MAG: 23S rRNA (guanosine(2251)-2'-O)-methyltransferase RlmB [Syntrophales bacterium]|nr:23S rRNA (guanosine(2251)-2'-O)-methyltransferase RlmB [Syntrophales bacterium]